MAIGNSQQPQYEKTPMQDNFELDADFDAYEIKSKKIYQRRAINAIALMFLICFMIFISWVVQKYDRINEIVSDNYDIKKICSPKAFETSSGKSECRKICEEASCCFEHGFSGCYKENQAMCDRHSPCRGIFDYDNQYGGSSIYHGTHNTLDHTVVPPAPKNINDICRRSEMDNLERSTECKEACLKASCCWETGCRSANVDVCANYEACGRIGDEGSSFPVEKTEVEYACSSSKLFSQGLSKEERGENMENCMNMCEKRSCCFSHKANNCYEDNMKWCADFSSCKRLYNTDVDTLPLVNVEPSDILTECADAFVHDKDVARCEEACFVALCCFTDGECEKRGVRCEEYSVCEPFLSSTYYVDTMQSMFQEENDDMTSPGLRESPQHKTVDVHNVNTNKLVEICSSESVKHEDSYDLCEAECNVAVCCAGFGDDNCKFTKPEFCESYSPCYAIWNL